MGKTRTSHDKPQDTRPPIAEVEPSVCVNSVCRSTRRTPFHNVRTLQEPGVLPDGRKYVRVVWRRTTCLDCGQVRVDKSYE